MSFKFSEFLLGQTKNYNGHLDAEVKGLSVEQGLELCKELEELTDNQHSFTVQLWTCGGYSIYQMDYWKPKDHILGHVDRLILSVEP